MRVVSALQLLPDHVLEDIVDHVTGSSRVWFDGVRPNSNEYRIMLRPLLSVCHGLRAIALSRYYGACKLEFASSPTYNFRCKRFSKYYASRPQDFGCRVDDGLDHSTHHLVKKLIVDLDEGGIYSGEALRMLTCAPYDGRAFPLIRKIVIRIFMDVSEEEFEDHQSNLSYKRRIRTETSPTNALYASYETDEEDHAIRPNVDQTSDPSALEANVSAFVRHIKQMAPLVDDIEVLPELFGYRELCTDHYGSLVTHLFRLAKHITYSDIDSALVPLELQPNQICDLVHISFGTDHRHNPFVQLAQRSRLTLQSLSIGQPFYTDLKDFIQEPGGSYVSYPCLLTLKLLAMHNGDFGDFPTFPGAVPFPSLRHLHMDVYYPFGDDTIFRGNAATLEYLKMKLDNQLYRVASEYNVFSRGSRPKL
ncbi:hypothetical protein H4S07_003174, partial [Coemansia furcata]